MKKVIRIGKKGKVKLAKALQVSEQPFDSRIGLIQSLIPLGLAMVNEEMISVSSRFEIILPHSVYMDPDKIPNSFVQPI